jgi:hypothetical protein
MATVRHGATPGSIEAILRSPSGAVSREMLRRGKNVERAAKRLVGVDSGRLRASIGTELVSHRGAPAAKVGSKVKYARWHHDGTGIFGPHKARIFPTRAKFLRFKPKGGTTWIFRYSVAGWPGNKYLKDALLWAKD